MVVTMYIDDLTEHHPAPLEVNVHVDSEDQATESMKRAAMEGLSYRVRQGLIVYYPPTRIVKMEMRDETAPAQ